MPNLTPIQNVVVTCLNYASVAIQEDGYEPDWKEKVRESIVDYVLAEYHIDLDPKKTEA